MTIRISVLLICVLFLTTLSIAKKNERKREFQQDSIVSEVGEENADDDDDDDDDEEVEIQCRWRWSKWKPCTKPCDSGNTTRKGLCICEGFNIPFADSECEDVPNRLDTEVVPCNEQKCGEKAACNKVCWMKILSRNQRDNITDGVFLCSVNCTDDATCPRGKTYSQILAEPVPPLAENVEWYYLAKEWYAAMLNLEDGVPMSSEAIDAMKQAESLLENCAGWGPDQLNQLANVYAVKEKLNRANNGIGGLDMVDEQVAAMVGGGSGDEDNDESNQKSLLALAISIPMIVVAIIAVAIMLTIYVVRRKTYVVVPPDAHIPESSLEHGKVVDLPLQDEHKGDDSSSEEKI